ncbi:MAG: Uma2 family endonuclease [Planctomycetes bacterium]|nr:Uma2 family endonuclease [Planctomycetota bacterium]
MSAIAALPQPLTTTAPPRSADYPRRWKWTREQYHELGKQGFFAGKRVQLIFGEIIEMSPQGWPHVLCIARVADALRRAFAGVAWVTERGPHPTADSEPEPDVRVIPGAPDDYTDHPTNALLLVEVADTSLFDDPTSQAELYATANVPEYWVVDLAKRQLHVFREPEPLPKGLGATAYRTHLVLDQSEAVSPLAASTAVIPIVDLLPKVPATQS